MLLYIMKSLNSEFVSLMNVFIIILVFLGLYYIINYTNLFRLDNSQTKETFMNFSYISDSSVPSQDPYLPYLKNKCGPIDINKFFFDQIEFSHDCCPAFYSSNKGCACMCPAQLEYLNTRAGNHNDLTTY